MNCYTVVDALVFGFVGGVFGSAVATIIHKVRYHNRER